MQGRSILQYFPAVTGLLDRLKWQMKLNVKVWPMLNPFLHYSWGLCCWLLHETGHRYNWILGMMKSVWAYVLMAAESGGQTQTARHPSQVCLGITGLCEHGLFQCLWTPRGSLWSFRCCEGSKLPVNLTGIMAPGTELSSHIQLLCRRNKICRHAKTCETQPYVELMAFQLHRERFSFVFAENGLSIRPFPCLRLYTLERWRSLLYRFCFFCLTCLALHPACVVLWVM